MLNLFLELAVAVLTLLVAAYVFFTPPRTLPKTLLALFLALMGARSFRAFDLLSPALPAGALSPWTGFIVDLNTLGMVALVGFLWVYPTRVAWRSWHAVALLGYLAVLVAGGAAWVLDRGLFYDLQPGDAWPGSQRAFAYDLWSYAIATGLGAALASGLSRAWPLAHDARRGAFVLLPMLALSPFTNLGGYALNVLRALAAGGEVLPSLDAEGDCCALVPALWATQSLLFAGLTVALAWKGRSYAAAGLVALGFLLPVPFLLAGQALNTAAAVFLLRAIAPLHVMSRHGVFDARPPRWGETAVAGVVMLLVFLQVNAFVTGAFATSPLAGALGIFLGLALGGAAAHATLPQGWALLAPPGHAAEGAERRLRPYRAALQAELDRGDGDGSRQLRALRAELGVSEQEHAALVFMLRPGAVAPGGTLQPGRLFLDRYQVLRALGEGSGGATHLCRDQVVDRDVVIKVLRAPVQSPEALQQVVREARAIGAIRHPNVVTLHDVLQVGPEVFIVMEHAEGGSLAARLARGRCGDAEFAAIAHGLLHGLEAVHAAGVVHRDVKPSNVLLTADGEPKLADFGVAHIRGFESTAGGTEAEGAVGTVRFMSPEQAKGRRATERSDLFSAGATLYEAYAGKPYLDPRPGETPMELQMRAARAAPFRGAVEPPALRAWFARALAPEPAARFASAREMREALARALELAA